MSDDMRKGDAIDPETRGGSSPDGRRVQGTIHWVSAAHAIPAKVRLYEQLFTRPDPEGGEGGQDFTALINPHSLTTLTACQVEPALSGAAAGSIFQFERQGYFCVDSRDSTPDRPVINRAVSLRDTWAKLVAGKKNG